jgi:hypothetical protein
LSPQSRHSNERLCQTQLTLSVPIRIKRRSGRKLVTLPSGDAVKPRPWDTAPTPLQLALARGHPE